MTVYVISLLFAIPTLEIMEQKNHIEFHVNWFTFYQKALCVGTKGITIWRPPSAPVGEPTYDWSQVWKTVHNPFNDKLPEYYRKWPHI